MNYNPEKVLVYKTWKQRADGSYCYTGSMGLKGTIDRLLRPGEIALPWNEDPNFPLQAEPAKIENEVSGCLNLSAPAQLSLFGLLEDPEFA